MKREIIRVEPLATYLEKCKAPTSTVTKHGDPNGTIVLGRHRTESQHSVKCQSADNCQPANTASSASSS
jgi:hypothetical protein